MDFYFRVAGFRKVVDQQVVPKTKPTAPGSEADKGRMNRPPEGVLFFGKKLPGSLMLTSHWK